MPSIFDFWLLMMPFQQAMAAALREGNERNVTGIMLTLIGIGIVLVILGGLFLIRKILMALFNVVLIIIGVLLIIGAVFGGPLGIYDKILG